MELTFETAGASGTAVAHVSELTGAKVRIFLSEIAEGVSNYRSMHSLTQQVEHQYHGRFLIELVQNAHDAFAERAADGQNRIDVVFDQADSIHGSLLVANDGAPFSASNFERLSQLGQSDKDPQKSIGNKGIGFRSVLEVSDCPEIYSRNAPGSPGFDGYCFAFRPDVVQSLVEPINQLSKSGPVPVWPISGEPLVNNWSDEMLAKFRKRVQSKAEGWLAGEAHFLSPYLLPVPLTRIDSERVADYASRGFATVVRLPLKSAELRNYVLERMRQLSGATMLFLNRVGTLHIAADEGEERTFTRKSTQLASGLNGERVVILDDSSAPREYGIWTRGLHVATAPEVFRKAVAALPGRWPDITDISVSVAVRLDADPENGRFSIYLPTLVPTGSAVHINAPFFGDMSRTSIPFEDAYNRHLLDVAADLSLEVVRSRLAGKGETEARAILDFLAPLDTGPAGQRWLQLMVEAETRASAALNEESLVLAEDGWQALNMTSLVPTAPKITLLTEDTLRRHATFHIFHSSLASRVAQIKSLAAARFSATGAYPLASDLAETIAAVAGELHTGGGDWNAFWRDTAALLPAGQAELAKHAVLLGADGALHRVSSGTKVFFVPRQGTQDDSDVGGEATATGVPAMLQPSVAFLNEQIQLYDPSRPAMQTPVRAYLGQGLVSQFRVETIFSEVLLQLTPAMPAGIEGAHLPLCRDILGWALRLMANVVARGRGVEATLRLLRAIPVPCEGGWLPMREASFSEGWPSTVGPTLKAYLGILKSGAANTARQRLLLPPSHPSWGEVGTAQMSLLASGGVLNGLRLLEIKPNAWASGFKASMFDFRLPGPPPLISKEQWSQFATIACAESKPPFTTPQQYEVGNVLIFPGMAEFESLAEEERLALSELILQSLPGWGAGLQKLVLSKQGGQWSRLEVTSPLKHFLQSTPWLSVREAKGPTWAQPSERWFVPADTLAGRARHYAHLRALPSGLAKHIGLHPELAAVLRDLGMKFFDPHSTTADPSLLQTLTESVGSDDVSDANVLLGQLRDAWQRFRPPIDRASLPMLAVRRRDRRLSTVTPSADSPAYLPDSGAYAAELEEFDFPVVAIGTADAKELREWFIAAYGARIQLTSTLALVPYVGDAVWTGSTATALADSELGWLVHPLLVMVAAQGRSVHSAAFKDREELLRSAQIDWVPNLRVAVMRETTALANTEVTALWEPLRKTLVIAEYCRTHPEALSGALAQALEREDLELSLRYVLRTVDMIDEAPDDLATFLAPLRITPEQIHQVLEHLRGDVGHMSRLVALLVAVLSPAADLKALKDARTEEELTTALAEVGISGLDVAHTLQVARDSQDMFDFGRAISPDFGEPASLAHWNAELIRLGQTQLANKRWGLQLQASMEEAAASAKRLAAHALRQGAMVSYTQMYSQYQGLVSSADLSHSHWTVTFQDAMTLFERLAASWLSDVGVLLAVQSAENPEMLRAGLADAGVPLEMDPDECGRKNHALVDSVARGLDRLRLVAWIRASVNLPNQEWHPFVDRYRAAAEAALAGDAFTREWPDAHVLALLRSGVRHPDLATFQTELDLSTDLASLQEALQVSGDELSKAQGQLDAIRTERMRRRSIVQVCGEDFDSSEDNLDQLWAFLSTKISDSDLAKTMSLNLVSPVALVPVKGRSPTRSDTSKPPARRPQRQSKSTDELVGLAGEIHVFRMLRQQYGEDAVPSSAWISENSRRVFGFNQADDARGCDFAFTAKGKQFRVEVKASTGDDESFTLGSSEIRLAMEIGTKGKRRREVFVLVHVKNALSPQPSAVVLPNPYDPKYTSVFRVEEADARVRYRIRN